MNIGLTDRIFLYLEQNGLSQTELARILGVKLPSVNEWKTGKSKPSPRLILKFLFHFKEIDANWLIHGISPESGKQIANGNYNVQAGTSANVAREPSHLQLENNHLKQLLAEKEKQINLLNKYIDK